ncbi:hypothetical protein Val02_81710 [Virgisporangium aliadipatigenens]|uniref:Uncharacterized protein n=1 Tax=Virgisporangium aliadipatigenens TaxID=741659 RepID=A0A8J3YWU1_9ACTN|nr:helix-turn-helix transcriptional regulator [Virgisporangium aliadipatigenens]GIJ51285.1 hypothetical protein Val02_81710 [Virgisporangium aliadipatigenens]
MADRQLTPHGEILERARDEVLHISAREAARRADISESRWRQVVTGQYKASGKSVPVKPTLRVLVAMSVAVDVDPWEVVEAARLDKAPTREIVQQLAQHIRSELAHTVYPEGAPSTSVVGTGNVSALAQTAVASATAGDATVQAVDEEIAVVLADQRLSDETKVEIIGLIRARRQRDLEETRRIVQMMGDATAG